MNYTNSPLATSTVLSPNYTSGRTTINRITIHHTATSPLTGKEIGNIFAKKSRNASCNYGIGNSKINGKDDICLIVEEKNRAWTSSNRVNDMLAITFEVSNSKYGEPWAISADARESIIDLCVDICQRYGIKEVFNIQSEIAKLPQSKRAAYANNYVVPEGKLLLTQHNYFASTACPGSTIKADWDKITADINSRLGVIPTPSTKPSVADPIVKNGTKGAQALALQKDLNYLGSVLVEDGIFGSKSVKALKEWQKKNGLVADGIYGALSKKKMTELLK